MPSNAERVIDCGFGLCRFPAQWNVIEPTATGGYTGWEQLDTWFAMAEEAECKTLVTLGNKPTWAGGATHVNGPPAAENFARYYAFGRAVAQRYAGRVGYYEIGNETDAVGWTAAQLKEANLGMSAAIRSVDTKGKIVGISLIFPIIRNGTPNAIANTLMSDPEVQAAVDAMSFHTYPNQYAPEIGRWFGPIDDSLRATPSYLASVGWKKPILITEFGYSTDGGDVNFLVSREEQARFLVRLSIINRTIADTVVIYRMHEAAKTPEAADPPEHHLGIVDGWGAPKPSYQALKVLHNIVGGSRITEVASGPVWVYRFASGYVLWTLTGTATYTLRGMQDYVRVATLYGGLTVQKTDGGIVTVSVSPSPIYVENN